MSRNGIGDSNCPPAAAVQTFLDLPMRFVIDAMTPEDWPQVRAIYVEGLATNEATFGDRSADLGAMGRRPLALLSLDGPHG